jgi:hypothetical protein
MLGNRKNIMDDEFEGFFGRGGFFGGEKRGNELV